MGHNFKLNNTLEPIKADEKQPEDPVSGNEWILPFLTPELAKCYQLNPSLWGPIITKEPKELRELIRECKKSKQPYDDLLRALYSSCVRTNFLSSLSVDYLPVNTIATSYADIQELLEESIHEKHPRRATTITSFVDIHELQHIRIDYAEMGYRYVKELSKTDVNWLVDAFGEPNTHQSFYSKWPKIRQNAIYRYCWKELAAQDILADYTIEAQAFTSYEAFIQAKNYQTGLLKSLDLISIEAIFTKTLVATMRTDHIFNEQSLSTANSSNSKQILNVNNPQKPSDSIDSNWVPEGQTVEIEGYSIFGGLIYFGQCLKSIQEPSFIDICLPIYNTSPAVSGKYIYMNSNYHCYSRASNLGDYTLSLDCNNYSEISPIWRAAYLEWLSTGRKDPKAHIGYVNLFFSGLERRALANTKVSASAQNDIPSIIEEVKRLLSIYGEIITFREYASNFLNILQMLHAAAPLYRTSPEIYTHRYGETPLTLAVALSQMVKDCVPLSVEWALAWCSTMYQCYRTPVQRCPEEFRELLKIRYNEKFGEGLKLGYGNKRLHISYQPINISMGQGSEIVLPDFQGMLEVSQSSTAQISDFVDACILELDGFSRYLGRNPEGRSSLEAMSYLPLILLKKRVETWMQLSEDEKERLRPQLLLSSLPGMDGFKNRIKLLEQDHRELLGKYLSDITKSDCYIDLPELKTLAKIYKMLGLDPRSLQNHAHVSAIGPIYLQTAGFVKRNAISLKETFSESDEDWDIKI